MMITSGTTNQQICVDVFRSFNITSVIRKNISGSIPTDSYGDLQSYIIETLLNMNNQRLRILYTTKKLAPFIYRIIINQRNYYRSEYNLNLIGRWNVPLDSLFYEPAVDCAEIIESRLSEEEIEAERLQKIIILLTNNNFGLSGRTQKEMEHDLAVEMFAAWIGVVVVDRRIVFVPKMSIREMSLTYVRPLKNGKFKHMERRLINRYVKKGLEIIRKESSV